ncbi:MAG TPA: amidase [Pirellulales bacterium]|nr:amidase [Pirellulales bacterium]
MSVKDSPRSDLLHLSAVEIASRVRGGELSAGEVIEAHIARIDETHSRLNALVVRTFERARHDAAAVDQARRRGETLSPLAGVPMTIKDCFHVAGTPTTLGLRRLAERPMAADASLVERLRQAGAIILGKTNVPELMLMHETDNPLYGRTNNPWNPDRSPGGSSGGEAAIVAAGGSVLGLANDLGGSIRQPAHSCGVCGFKPSTGRLTTLGMLGSFTGMEAIAGQPGPIARHVSDLNLFMQTLVDGHGEPADPNVVPLAWSDPRRVDVSRLRVAMWTDDGYFAPSPAVRRAVLEAAEVLRGAGACVEPLAPPDVHEAMRLYFSLLSADGGASARRLLDHDPVNPEVRHLLNLARLPRWLRPGLGWLWHALGQRHAAELLRSTAPASASQYWQITHRRRQYVLRFLQTLDAGGYDALLCPVHALPALTHGSFRHLPGAGSYSMLTNLLGVPSGTVPITTVRPGEESDRRASHDRVERAALAVEANSAGLPIGVQVASRMHHDDVALALMQVLETHFRGQSGYPHAPPI